MKKLIKKNYDPPTSGLQQLRFTPTHEEQLLPLQLGGDYKKEVKQATFMLSAMISMITVITMIQIIRSFCASTYSTCRPVTSTNPALRRLGGGATELKIIQITSALFFILFSTA